MRQCRRDVADVGLERIGRVLVLGRLGVEDSLRELVVERQMRQEPGQIGPRHRSDPLSVERAHGGHFFRLVVGLEIRLLALVVLLQLGVARFDDDLQPLDLLLDPLLLELRRLLLVQG